MEKYILDKLQVNQDLMEDIHTKVQEQKEYMNIINGIVKMELAEINYYIIA